MATPVFEEPVAVPGYGVDHSGGGCCGYEPSASGSDQVNAPLNEGTKKAPPGGEAGRLLFPAGCLSVTAVDTEDSEKTTPSGRYDNVGIGLHALYKYYFPIISTSLDRPTRD